MYTFALSSVVSKYTVNRRFLTWCKICSISRKSAISLFKTGPRCSCRTAKSKHKLLLCEVHKSSSIVQVTTVVLSLQKRSVSLSSLFPANVKYEKNGLKEVFLWHVEIPTKWKVYKPFSRSKHRPPCWCPRPLNRGVRLIEVAGFKRKCKTLILC